MNELSHCYNILGCCPDILVCVMKVQSMMLDHLGRAARKPVFGVSDKASFKPVSLATETS